MAEKNKDMIDMMVHFGMIGKGNSTGGIPEQIYDYPERLVPIVTHFYTTWKLPEGAIPSKKRKKNYGEWVAQLEELFEICPIESKMNQAMKLAKSNYNLMDRKFPIVRPLSIKNMLINAVREINDYPQTDEQKESKNPATRQELTGKTIEANKDSILKTVRRMKINISEKGEESS